MKKASNAEPDFSHIDGGSVARRADGNTARTEGREAVPLAEHKSSGTLWLWVSGGFLLMLLAWTIMFTVARSAKIESVPLSTSGGGAR